MTIYRIVNFERELIVDDDAEVIAAGITADGSNATRSASNYALVAFPEEDAFECGAETASGTCGRAVDSEDQHCWQHE